MAGGRASATKWLPLKLLEPMTRTLGLLIPGASPGGFCGVQRADRRVAMVSTARAAMQANAAVGIIACPLARPVAKVPAMNHLRRLRPMDSQRGLGRLDCLVGCWKYGRRQ